MRIFDDWTEISLENNGGHWHLSVDIDVLDPEITPGVTNPLPDGWFLERLFCELEALFAVRKPDSVSLVEATSESAETISIALQIESEIDRLYEYYEN